MGVFVMRRWLPLFVLLLLPIRLLACINDRDTDALVEEARDLPELGYIVTGRFDRNPPLYYQMRIQRILSEIRTAEKEETEIQLLLLHDDIAAAYDRLGKSDEAVQWMEKKRQWLVKLAPQFRGGDENSDIRENWYRYHANVGTFLAHRWLRAGAKPETLSQMKAARDHIAKALKIKPNAHFGRERFQLKTMEWIIDLCQRKASAKQGATYDPKTSSTSDVLTLGAYILKTEKPEEAVTGLAGLVALGNAWESVDVFDAIAQCLYKMRKARVGYLTSLRVKELLTDGKQSFVAKGYFTGERMEAIAEMESRFKLAHMKATEEKFQELRAGAEKWHKHRTEFMLAQLKAGKHPDTNQDFWNGYTEVPAVSLDIPWQKEAGTNLSAFLIHNLWLVGMVLLSIVAVILWGGVWSIKKLIAYVRHRMTPI